MTQIFLHFRRMFSGSRLKAASLLLAAFAFCSCARQFHYSTGEAGRVAGYFHMDEAEVSRIYADSGFSWDAAIARLLEEKTLSGPGSTEDFSARFELEAEKIKRECGIE